MQIFKRLMKHVKILTFVALILTAILPAAFAENFHINDKADTLATSEAQAFVGSSVGTVTAGLGSPSMVRFNRQTPDTKIDYIYIGSTYVYTFEVKKELGKQVVAYYRDGRTDWENGIYPGYPKPQ